MYWYLKELFIYLFLKIKNPLSIIHLGRSYISINVIKHIMPNFSKKEFILGLTVLNKVLIRAHTIMAGESSHHDPQVGDREN